MPASSGTHISACKERKYIENVKSLHVKYHLKDGILVMETSADEFAIP